MSALPDYTVLDPGLERLPVEPLRALQAERLRAMVRYVYDATPFWRRKLDANGLTPDQIRGLEDLSTMPWCTKPELQADQRDHPPFGSYVGTSRRAWVRFFATSGTTGAPLRRVFSARDWGYVLDRFRRNPRVGPGDISITLGPIDGLMGPTAGAEHTAQVGAMSVLAGLSDSRTKVMLIRDLRPSVVIGTASYLLHLVEVAAGMGIDLRTLGVRTVLSVGEPGAAVDATRRRLIDGWGAFVNDGYGMTELFPLGGGCRHSRSLHIASDLVITEIVDPETGRSLPPGEPGEVVYTNLVGDTQPLLRYRTRDIATLAPPEPCACGFTGARLVHAIEGRVDDMIWIRGVNVFPSAIEAVVRSFAELTPEYQAVVDGSSANPSLRVRVEVGGTLTPAAHEALARRLTDALRSAIRVRAGVEILPGGTLPRADGRGKLARVVDRRAG
jgi:phenylacetate-CoA ligase